MDDKRINNKKEREILKRLCKDEGVKFSLIERLIQVEREHQLKSSRYGIYDNLKEILKEFSQNEA